MARIDDFQQARDLSAGALAEEDIHTIAARCGFEVTGDGAALRVPFLDRVYRVTFPDFIFADLADTTAQVPLQEQVLLLHYMQGVRPLLTGEWIAYREIPGAGFYFSAFVKRAIDPLKQMFGQNTAALLKAAQKLGAIPLETGDAAFELRLLPFAPIQVIVWEGDDEFPAEANVLFDASIGEYLPAEDAAWLASLPVYRLMALAR
ncbi:MAG: DUF3786 domain-containing protein [Desulfatitalea sp.]|nr:DUF3786 domain-containing protein [Desulfatitalea sp.]NNK00082.1 DUF3786 domain-containing protein [Desulfatitalea sp.]